MPDVTPYTLLRSKQAEIDTLQGENQRLRDALQEIGDDDSEGWCGVVARAALSVSPAAKKQP